MIYKSLQILQTFNHCCLRSLDQHRSSIFTADALKQRLRYARNKRVRWKLLRWQQWLHFTPRCWSFSQNSVPRRAFKSFIPILLFYPSLHLKTCLPGTPWISKIPFRATVPCTILCKRNKLIKNKEEKKNHTGFWVLFRSTKAAQKNGVCSVCLNWKLLRHIPRITGIDFTTA